MRWWNKLLNRNGRQEATQIRLITDWGDAFRAWNGTLYQSDIVRAAIRPKVKAIGKLTPMHVREGDGGLQVNPEPYMRILLEEPNPYSSGQMFFERLASLLSINNNAFAEIVRDDDDLPIHLYPIDAQSAQAVKGEDGRLYIRFLLIAGETRTLPYSDLIHLRDDYSEHRMFGAPKADALQSLLDVISASDQSIVTAVRRSAVIRWLMKVKVQLNPKDREKLVRDISNEFLSLDNDTGIIPTDPARYELDEVKSGNQYVPQSPHQQRAIERIYSFFGVNEKIVQASYSENEWIAYYESEIEPLAKQMSHEFTRKLFTRRERGFGNRIVFGATDLSYASMSTKLQLSQMVDRGAMTPNEWRRVLNLPPIEGGDKPVRRLDTAVVNRGKGRDEGKVDKQFVDAAQDQETGIWVPREKAR